MYFLFIGDTRADLGHSSANTPPSSWIDLTPLDVLQLIVRFTIVYNEIWDSQLDVCVLVSLSCINSFRQNLKWTENICQAYRKTFCKTSVGITKALE